MKFQVVGLCFIIAASAGQAGPIDDTIGTICAAGPGPNGVLPCSAQNDNDQHRDADDACASPLTTATATTGTAFDGILLIFEDESDWYDTTIPSAGNVGIRVEPAVATEPVMNVRLEVLETDCSTPAVGDGTVGAGTRVSNTEYKITDALANQDIRLGILIADTATDTFAIGPITIETNCHPLCAILDNTAYEAIEYVVQFYSF